MKRDARSYLVLVNFLLLFGVLASFVFHGRGTWKAPDTIAPALTPLPNESVFDALDRMNANLPFLTERPLFWLSRRPLPVQAQGLGSLDGAQLLGTFSDGLTQGAVIRLDKKTKKIIRLLVGEAYQGQVLIHVNPYSVEFSDPAGSKRQLKLEYAKQPTVSPGVPPLEATQAHP